MIVERELGAYVFSDDPARLDLDRVEAFIRQTYWAASRTREQIEAAQANSMCFGVYRRADGVQVAYARAVTDRVTFAWLCDVFVDPAERGAGLGKFLVESILEHPELVQMRRWMLATRDAHGLYAQYGFTPLATPETWMELTARASTTHPPDPHRSR